MPPKSKKEQEDQAKRLQEEQKRKEEEEARLAIQRKKYSSQTLSTGLQLPASNQLIIDLSTQSVQFIDQKLKEAVLTLYPNLANDQHLLKTILKELIYYSVDVLGLFNLSQAKQVEGYEEQLLKARVLIGIALRIMINQHPSLGGKGKSKQLDQKLFKELISLHVVKGQGKLKVYDIKDVQNVLNCIRKGYFNHYLLLFNFNKFKKRQDISQTRIYISTATSFRNHKDTPFTDLSHKKEEVKS